MIFCRSDRNESSWWIPRLGGSVRLKPGWSDADVQSMTRKAARITLQLALVALLIGLGMAGIWRASERHALIPGVRGCPYVRDTLARGSCYSERIANMQGNQSGRDLARAVSKLAVHDAALASHCHEGLHPIGMRDGTRAYVQHRPMPPLLEGDRCLEGYSHGVLIGYQKNARVSELIANADRICDRRIGTTELDCLHALGHLFERKNRNIETSVTHCAQINVGFISPHRPGFARSGPSADVYNVECYKGVFMERAFRDRAHHHIPSRLCAAIQHRQDVCAFYLPMYTMMVGKSFDQAVAVCDSSTFSANIASACARGVAAIAINDRDCQRLRPPMIPLCTETIQRLQTPPVDNAEIRGEVNPITGKAVG